jgi:predicted NUDIX family NTP pyrophosphohydrolase
MAKRSAGILMYRHREGRIEFLLVHPGGPFWKNKDDGAWSIPKGEIADDEDALAAARREFEEEAGTPPQGDFRELDPVKQKGGKTVLAWAVEGDLDASAIRSNTFLVEWPPRSGKRVEFPEVDRAGWFGADEARRKINAAQVDFVEQVERWAK